MNEFLMLHIHIQGFWIPAMVESEDCPLPTYIVVNKRFMADLTEAEWIAQYRQRTNATEELRFHKMDT